MKNRNFSATSDRNIRILFRVCLGTEMRSKALWISSWGKGAEVGSVMFAGGMSKGGNEAGWKVFEPNYTYVNHWKLTSRAVRWHLTSWNARWRVLGLALCHLLKHSSIHTVQDLRKEQAKYSPGQFHFIFRKHLVKFDNKSLVHKPRLPDFTEQSLLRRWYYRCPDF